MHPLLGGLLCGPPAAPPGDHAQSSHPPPAHSYTGVCRTGWHIPQLQLQESQKSHVLPASHWSAWVTPWEGLRGASATCGESSEVPDTGPRAPLCSPMGSSPWGTNQLTSFEKKLK